MPVYTAINSNYELISNFPGADLTALDRSRGPRVVLSWGSGPPVTGVGNASSSIPIDLPAPVVPATGSDTFTVSAYASPGPGPILSPGECVDLGTLTTTQYSIYAGQTGAIVIDRSKGDPGHPGVSFVSDNSNSQAKKSLGGPVGYGPVSNYKVQITGHMCGAANLGPGAILNQVYRVYWIDTSSLSPHARRAAIKAGR